MSPPIDEMRVKTEFEALHSGQMSIDAPGDDHPDSEEDDFMEPPPSWEGVRYCVCESLYEEGEFMIGCEKCEAWFHVECIGLNEEDALDPAAKFYCKTCDADGTYRLVFPDAKRRRRRSPRAALLGKRDYAALHEGFATEDKWARKGTEEYHRFIETRPYASDTFPRKRGDEMTPSIFLSGELREPTLISSPDGLGMKMPSKDLTVSEIVDLVGSDRTLEVLDVASQSELKPAWTLGQWRDYFEKDPKDRKRILNVISLEISHTKFGEVVDGPKVVKEVGWIESLWPKEVMERSLDDLRKNPYQPAKYPKVQLYCLMSVQGCFTDFHVDFGGSSVWYHILRGEKIFYFIKPTPTNLRKYEEWSTNASQNSVYFGDEVDSVVRVELSAGNTMIIPTGWIHAVYTPQDSIVFGGNFLTTANLGLQLKIQAMEIRTAVPRKFQFPFYTEICWYVAADIVRRVEARTASRNADLTALEELGVCRRALSGLSLLEHLLTYKLKKERSKVPREVRNPKRVLAALGGIIRSVETYRHGRAEETSVQHVQESVQPLMPSSLVS